MNQVELKLKQKTNRNALMHCNLRMVMEADADSFKSSVLNLNE